MEKKTIRLIYPQWQGGDIARWIPEVDDPCDAARGYALGAQMLAMLAPEKDVETHVVPVSMDASDRRVTDGVLDRDTIALQTRAALDIVRGVAPDRIVTLGGDCSVSVVPFTYLLHRYGGDVALVWIDAHPDITLPGDAYAGYHAMAVTACMGLGDGQILSCLPARFDASKILFVGLRDWERDEIRLRQQQYGICHLSPADIAAGLDGLRQWLRTCGASARGGTLRHGRARPRRDCSRRRRGARGHEDGRGGRGRGCRGRRKGAGGADCGRADAPDGHPPALALRPPALAGLTRRAHLCPPGSKGVPSWGQTCACPGAEVCSRWVAYHLFRGGWLKAFRRFVCGRPLR